MKCVLEASSGKLSGAKTSLGTQDVKDESQDVTLKTSLQDVGPNSQDVTGRFTRRPKTFGGSYSGGKTSQDASIRSLPGLCEVGADLQDVTRRLGAFALEPRRRKTLPYAASPDYVKFQAMVKRL